jgi:serine/threonine protein kinase
MAESADAGALDTRALRPGMVVGGKFALLRRIGEGGVGVVFEAEDTWIGRRVALKVLHSHLVDHADMLARFRREARAAATTNHPNIVAVFEVGQWHDGSPYIVQELLDGEPLREMMTRDWRLKPEVAIEIIVPIMGALVAAHRAGIVHRDIKPENIFLFRTPEGAVIPKLIDFGIAKIAAGDHHTLRGALLGTPAYMSPEQVGGLEADHRSDVWAIGAVLYEMLAGQCPYEGPSGASVLAKILTEPVPLITKRVPAVPAELAAVVHKALARNVEERWLTMQEFLDALLVYAQKPDPSISTRHAASIPPPPSYTMGPQAAPNPAAPAAPASVPPISVTQPAHPSPISPLAGSDPGEPAEPPRPQRSPSEWARPMVQPELGWYEGRPSPRAPRDLAWYTAAAGEALRDNALDEAIDHAEHAIVTCRAGGDTLGHMRLVQCIALRWLGHYAESERCAVAAADALERGSPGWYAAIGHLALLGGYLGKNDRFASILADLAALEERGPVAASHVVAASRLAISLVRAGLVDRASRALASARARAEAGTEDEPMVRAWIYAAAAEFMMHGGDPTGYLKNLEDAVTCFSEAGDVRNACLQRANIGNGYMQLGAYARAKGLLREALAVGEPMRLGFIAPVRANLGFVLARLGDVEQALEIETAALEQCIRERYRRFELAARIYLAQILVMRAQPARAEEELQSAVEGAGSAPAIRAYGLAALADFLFEQKRPAEAREAAREAMGILRDLEGVEEGESLIRLVHALALESVGDEKGAAAAIADAKKRLLDRADRINDPRLRRSFLDHIPENARTLAVAARYKTGR